MRDEAATVGFGKAFGNALDDVEVVEHVVERAFVRKLVEKLTNDLLRFHARHLSERDRHEAAAKNEKERPLASAVESAIVFSARAPCSGKQWHERREFGADAAAAAAWRSGRRFVRAGGGGAVRVEGEVDQRVSVVVEPVVALRVFFLRALGQRVVVDAQPDRGLEALRVRVRQALRKVVVLLHRNQRRSQAALSDRVALRAEMIRMTSPLSRSQ